MRRFALLLTFALVAAACGGGDGDAATTEGTGPATSAATTTTAGPSTTADPAADRIARALAFAGTYAGEWHNTTFDTTGPVDVEVEVDADAKFLRLRLDLGGSVFGGPDPDPLVVELDLAEDGPYAGSNDLVGDYTFDIDDSNHFLLTAPSVPGVGGLALNLEGDIDPAGFTLDYEIVGLAVGVITVAPVG